MKSKICSASIITAIIIFSILIIGCGQDEEGEAILNIQFKLAPGVSQQAEITRVVVIVSGPDIETQEIELEVSGRKASGVIAVPSGEERTIQVKAYAGDVVEFEGEAFVDHPKPGTEIPITIQLKPVGGTQKEEKIFEIGNNGGVSSLPTSPSIFTLDKPYIITQIITYHWNGAQGSTPGTISLTDANRKTYGPWQAVGSDGQGGVKNAYWTVKPNIELPAGTYTVIDSDPKTWAQNDSSDGQGFVVVYGYPAGGGGNIPTGSDDVKMAYISAGEFQMGGDNGLDREKPVHTVYLDAFYIDMYEVTNGQYKKFMDATGYKAPQYWSDPNFNAPDQPVVGVSWFDASAYAKWVGKRLPTEAEWEKSARGGFDKQEYTWGNDADRVFDYANGSGIGGVDRWEYTAPIGSFMPNGYGLYDMIGNVWEWCADWYDHNYYSNSPKSNPKGPNSGSERILRGGGCYDNANYFRLSYRFYYNPSGTGDPVGFRCAR